MIFSKIENLTKTNTILVAPLDWGLGHATRCIPIINQLLLLNCKVIIASDGAQKKILSEAFPKVEVIVLKGYRIKYSKTRQYFFLSLFLQIPKILRTIHKEQRWLKKVVTDYNINAVISDNRFGVYHSTLPCAYITHQLAVKTGFNVLDKFASRIHRAIIKKFSTCWVPDAERVDNSAAGELSHPTNPPGNVDYIGCISRFEELAPLPKLFNIVAVVSGPEPQRTIFETLLLASFSREKGKILLVRGLPSAADDPSGFETEHLTIKNHLNQQELNQAMIQAETVVCRSGYTTIMDLLRIKQRAILIPTPGQTEQEYLGRYLHDKQIFYSVTQQNFHLQQDLLNAAEFPYHFPEMDMDLYRHVVTHFVQSL